MKQRIVLVLLLCVMSIAANPLTKKRYAQDDSHLIFHRNSAIEAIIKRYHGHFKDDVSRAQQRSPRDLKQQIATYCSLYREMIREREKAHKTGKRLLEKYRAYEFHMTDAIFELQQKRCASITNDSHMSYRNIEA